MNYHLKRLSKDYYDVVIRTDGNMCVLNIDAANSHVEHYGYAKTTNVIAVNTTNSYHEFGTSNQLMVTSGKVVIEETGVVFHLDQTSGSTATVTNNGGNVMESSIPSVVPSTSFEINSLSQLIAFRDATNSGEDFAGKTVNLNVDIELNGSWKAISNYWRKTNVVASDKWFAGEFNGKGHTISGLTNKGLTSREINTGYNSTTPAGGTEFVYGLFGSVNGANIHDLKLKDVNIVSLDPLLGDGIGALIGYSAGATISNVEVSGSVIGFDAVGGIVGRARGANFSMTNCTNNAEVKSLRLCAGIVGQLGEVTNGGTLTNCTNNGNVTCEYTVDAAPTSKGYYWAAGIANINTGNKSDTYTLTGCVNNGTIANNGHLPDQKAPIYSTCSATLAEGKVIVS